MQTIYLKIQEFQSLENSKYFMTNKFKENVYNVNSTTKYLFVKKAYSTQVYMHE